ncbi:CCGSCS motif protein [Thalassomonas haliotis]|uniref:CCGSCS motif protein n=1 Tax=Thalassomonas haliotis TaxID=485448 RepID=A0ABY7VCQ9_9GAMM|nr:CCGSCS motif protein [Thalassomonas haliotis]WDE11399.1 CCGSCS motif protein [Thalassomonas haliotis]
MFNIFKKSNKELVNDDVALVSNRTENAVEENQEVEAPRQVHGENGVCCGSCGGQ